jgi:acyl-CoA dehydrogenase
MSEMRTQLVETADALIARGADADVFARAGFGSLRDDGDWGDVVAVLSRIGRLQPELDALHLIVGDEPDDCALGIVGLAAGAIDACLALSIDHANTRVQFGKQLGKQQAVQQALALLAEEAAAVAVAGQAAARARDLGDASFEIACAKLRTNIAIGSATAIAHQVHGAIGFTQEHDLHRFTRALLNWRSAYGNDAHWAARAGGFAAREGGTGVWAMIAAR